jgi:hypothetical protein
MKKIFTIVFLLTSVVDFSQPSKQHDSGFNRIQTLKIAYLTRQLNLTSDEAAKFWPVYYAYNNETVATRKESADNVIAGDEKLLNVKKRYSSQFKNILGTDERVNKVFLSERNFGNMIRKEIEARQKLRQQRTLLHQQQKQSVQ